MSDLIRRVVARTAAYTLKYMQPDRPGTIFTNRGATGSVTFTLPTPAVALQGVFFEFRVHAAQTIIVAGAAAGALCTIGNAAADNVSFATASAKVGRGIKVICDGTQWLAFPIGAFDGFCVNGTELAFRIGGTALTPTAAEINALAGAVAGAITASQAVTRDAGARIPFKTLSPAAAGNSAGTATAITADVNHVTAADGTTGVILPVGVAGMRIEIENSVTTATALLKVYPDTGGAINGGSANASFSVAPGGRATFVCTAALTWVTAPNDALLAVAGVAARYKIARGENQQATASDTVVTGLATVVAVVVSPRTITVKQMWFQGSIGDQAGTPAAGSILITSKKPTSNVNDSTPTAATDFTENIKVNWIAIGT